MTTALENAIIANGLTVTSEFVPFSRSRNAENDTGRSPDKRSLNWRVTLHRDGKPILTTDYSAGLAHCPSYKPGARWTLDYAELIEHETETGTTAKRMNAIGFIAKGKPITPKTADVVYSLVLDAGVLDARNFEDWASEYGYDTDSRKAETIYRACLEIALQLRNGLGEAMLADLRDAAQEY